MYKILNFTFFFARNFVNIIFINCTEKQAKKTAKKGEKKVVKEVLRKTTNFSTLKCTEKRTEKSRKKALKDVVKISRIFECVSKQIKSPEKFPTSLFDFH
jgi:hypothetical protein